MNNTYHSTAMFCGTAIDSRCLTLAFEFYMLTKTQWEELAAEMILWLQKLLPRDQFISRETNPRTIEKELNKLRSTEVWYMYSLEAFASSPRVYNIKSLSQHKRNYLRGVYEDVTDPLRDRVKDHLQFWDELFPNGREENAQVVSKILQIFNTEGKIPIKNFYLPDVQAFFVAKPYKEDNLHYYGDFFLDFSAFCLGDNLQSMADDFADFAQRISETYVNLNARIMLQPKARNDNGHSPYWDYFGRDGCVDDSHLDTNCTEKEWYRTYYLPGVEWMNIVSPLAASHLSMLNSQDSGANGVVVKPLSGGGVLIGADICIGAYCVSDARRLKKLLYPALYPGRNHVPLSWLFAKDEIGESMERLPRDDWAIVPVFDDEIKIASTYLVYEHLG